MLPVNLQISHVCVLYFFFKVGQVRLLYFSREQIEPNKPVTVTVPLLEQYWQRVDGQATDREHLLMALAELDNILIKATYTTNTQEAAYVNNKYTPCVCGRANL